MQRFDEFVRRLVEERNRRSVLIGLGSSVVSLLAISAGADAADGNGVKGEANAGCGMSKGKGKGTRKNRNRDGSEAPGGPGVEGPCGNGTRKDNICMENSQCCTGVCDLSVRKKNVDKMGRCRCIARGGACTEDSNCCNSPCIGNICGVPA
jgi:hypothetical protein